MSAYQQISINIITYQRIYSNMSKCEYISIDINTYQLASIIEYLLQIFGVGPAALLFQGSSYYVNTLRKRIIWPPKTSIQALAMLEEWTETLGQYISTGIFKYEQIWMHMSRYQYISSNIKYQYISANIIKYEQIWTHINKYRGIPIHSNENK